MEEASKALSLSLGSAPCSELILPSDPFQGLAAGFARERRQAGGPTWRGGCRAAPGRGWCLPSLARASLAGGSRGRGLCVARHHTPSTRRRSWAPQMFAERVLGGTGGWVEGGQVCFFIAASSTPWHGEAKEAENRGVREKSQVSTGILRALGQADWPFHTARDAGSNRQRWNLFLGAAKAQSDLTDQAE